MALLLTVKTDAITVLDTEEERSFYAHVWSTTHPSYSLVLTPVAFDSPSQKKSDTRMQFYLSLTALADSDGRGDSQAPFCPVRAAPDVIDRVLYYMPRGTTIPSPHKWTIPPTLHIAIYEEILTAMPGSDDSTVMDPVTANALKIQGNSNADGSRLRRSLMNSQRIGVVGLGWADLIAGTTQASLSGSVTSFTLPLIDDRMLAANKRNPELPYKRGHVQVTVDHAIRFSGVQFAKIREWVEAADQSPNPRQYYVNAAKNELMWRGLYYNYISAYVKAFPEFDMPFQLVKEKFRRVGFGYASPLVPATSNIGDIHMPLIETPAGPAPLGWYYIHATRREIIDGMHERYLASILDAACQSHHITMDELTATIHHYLNNDDDKKEEEEENMLACLEVVGYWLTAVACAGKYRSDFRIIGRGRLHSLESIDFDRITCASACDDCEGCCRCTQEIVHIVYQGRKDQPLDATINKDPLWAGVLLPRLLKQHPVGGWRVPAMSACQRLLGYYASVSVLGSVTDPMPGLHGMQRPDIEDIDAAQQEWRLKNVQSNVYKSMDYYIYGTDTNLMVKSGAHQFGLLMPLRDLVAMYDRGLRAEESGGGGLQRHPRDQAIVDKMKALHQQVQDAIAKTKMNLPALLLESTCRTSGFLVGPSVRHSTLRSLDVKQRTWMNEVKKASLTRRFIIQIKDLHGMRAVQGDLENRRASRFYRELLHGTSRRLWQLLGGDADAAHAMTFTWIYHSQGQQHHPMVWGVPIEEVMRPGSLQRVSVVPIMHRIPYDLRQSFWDATEKWIAPQWPPVRIGKFATQGDASFQYPTQINLQQLQQLLESVHRPTEKHRTEFDALLGRLNKLFGGGDGDTNQPIYERVFNQRIYMMPLRAATITDDWMRLVDFIETHNERITRFTHQRLIPAFGPEEIVIATRVFM